MSVETRLQRLGAAARQNWPYSLLLAIDVVIGIGVTIGKLLGSVPQNPYLHLLVSYQDGFIKRALLGEIVFWFTVQVSPALLYEIATASFLLALVLYLVVFRRDIGFATPSALALLCFTAGSPFSFKNFIKAAGYLDIYGAIAAMLALLIPIGIAAELVLVLVAAALVLMHHLHLLLYLPAIALIYLLRAGAGQLAPIRTWIILGLAGVGLAALALFIMFEGTPVIDQSHFLAGAQARATYPLDPRFIAMIYYPTLGSELANTAAYLVPQLKRVPLFLLVAALHLPFWLVFRNSLRALPQESRRVAVAGLIAISAGYVVICLTVLDWARWYSSWFVCMVLCFHAVRMAGPNREAPDLKADSLRTRLCATAVTGIPFIGIVFIF
jgi:hypothetical protein